MVFFSYKEKKIGYQDFGKGDVLLFLHGWGCDGKIFLELSEIFSRFYRCLIIDFPPFGKSEEPKEIWGVGDYAQMVKEFLDMLHIKKFKIIAHSFGGRVALNLASCYNNNVTKMVLTGAAGLKSKFNLLNFLKISVYKTFKKFYVGKNMGSVDYRALSNQMKKSFVKIIKHDQTEDCEKIICPTLLIYGKNDDATPVYMAKKLNKLIKNSKLIILKNSGHFCFLDSKEEFFDLAYNFLKGKNNEFFSN